MPVNIYRVAPEDQEKEKIAWLCDNEWLLWVQVEALARWLEQFGSKLPPAEYVADIGFCWCRSARAGGPVLEPVMLRLMADAGMSLYLSEYPGFAEESKHKYAELSGPANGSQPTRPDSNRTSAAAGSRR